MVEEHSPQEQSLNWTRKELPLEERSYPSGLDCVWIGSDRDGRVGAFVTGGEGPIPASALLSRCFPVEDIETRLVELPLVGSATLRIQMKKPDDFLALAERGLFAYDWTDVHRTKSGLLHAYELIAAPERPVSIGELPREIAVLLGGIVMKISFPQEIFIDVTKHFECRHSL